MKITVQEVRALPLSDLVSLQHELNLLFEDKLKEMIDLGEVECNHKFVNSQVTVDKTVYRDILCTICKTSYRRVEPYKPSLPNIPGPMVGSNIWEEHGGNL